MTTGAASIPEIPQDSGGIPSLPALPPSVMQLTSKKTAGEARAFFLKQTEAMREARGLKGRIETIDRVMGEYNAIIDVIVDARDTVRTTAQKVDKLTFQFFSLNQTWDYFFLIDGGIFNIVALFRRGLSFSVAVNEAHKVWKHCNIKERLDVLADATFKASRVGETLLSLTDKIIAMMQFTLLSVPLTCIGIVHSTIMAIKTFVMVISIETRRKALLAELGQTEGIDRFYKAMDYCESYDKKLDQENEALRPTLKGTGIESFLQTRKKWALTSFFGTKSYPTFFQGFERLANELEQIDKEIKILEGEAAAEVRDQHLSFLKERKSHLVVEGNVWIDKFISVLTMERSQQAATCIQALLMMTASTLILAGLFATVHYWGPVLLAILVLATTIALVNSLYTLWQRQRITHQEKEHALNLVTEHFTKEIVAAEREEQKKIAAMFGFTIDAKIIDNTDLVAKQFEEHLKTVLHQEKIDKFIDKAFVDAIRSQVVVKGKQKTPNLVELQNFRKQMFEFFHKVMKTMNEDRTEIVLRLQEAAIVRKGKSLEERLADEFFIYLNHLAPDVVS